MQQQKDQKYVNFAKCKGNNWVTKICTQNYCDKPAFFCETHNCKTCRINHSKCQSFKTLSFIDGKLEKIVKYLQNTYLGQFNNVEQVQISKMNKLTPQMDKVIKYGWDQHKRSKILRQIFEKRSIGCLTGSQAIQIILFIMQMEYNGKKEVDRRLILNIYKEFVEKFDYILKQYQQLKLKAITALIRPSSKLVTDSKIISYIEGDGQILYKWLNKPVNLRLIFRASLNDFRASKFHQVCDNTNDTLVILKNEFGKRIGGFTPLKWNSSKMPKADKYFRTFIFSLNLKKRMPLQKSESAVYCNNSYGPIFGAANDLCIGDKCNAQRNSSVSFFSYHSKEINSNPVKAAALFAGNQSGNNFRVLEYEIFKVDWE